MIAKIINNDQFKEAIKIAFQEDKDLHKFYDPNKRVDTIDDIVNDVHFKVSEFNSMGLSADVEIKGLYEKGKLVGYYVFRPSLLISFSLNVQYRTRPYLKSFWGLIKKDLERGFNCYLWSKNIRAVKWLQKMGMQIVSIDNLLTKLKCQ